LDAGTLAGWIYGMCAPSEVSPETLDCRISGLRISLNSRLLYHW